MSGSFTGTAKGMGEVSVTLTLTDNVITDCTAKGDEETSGIGSVVIEQFPGEVVEVYRQPERREAGQAQRTALSRMRRTSGW